MKYELKRKYRLIMNAFLVKQFKIWCSVLLVIAGSSYMLKNTYADSNPVTHWEIGVAGQEDSVVADYENGTLTISGRGTMGSVYTDASNPQNTLQWKDYANDITKVVIKGEITATDLSHMFYNLINLTTIEGLDNLNTNQVTNMLYMFGHCKTLTAIDVSHFNTSQVTNMCNMFFNCKALTGLDISNFDTSRVINMSYMFANCTALTQLDLSHFDTNQVTNINGMFYGCQELSTLDISRFNTSKVTNMSNAFNSCQALNNLDVSQFDTSQVTDMSYMFSFCQALTNLDLSNFDTSQVTDMNNMFSDCQALTSLDLSDFDTRNVYNMMNMFSYCKSLVKVNGLTISKDSRLVYNVFYETPNLSQIQIKTAIELNVPVDTNHSWIDEDGRALNIDRTNAVIPVSDEYKTYTLSPAITHDITYVLNGGTLESKQDKFEILKEYELPTPTKELYFFDGWYDGAAFDKKISKIEKYTLEDKTVYAKWTKKAELQANNFNVKLSSETYTGNEITYTITSLLEGVGTTQVKKIEKNGVEVSKVKEAGTYKIIFDVAEADQYKSATVTKTFTISQATNSWKDELHIENWTYGEKANVPTSQVSFGEVKYTYSSSKNGKFTENKPTTAGTWYVKAQVNETGNYTGLEEVREFNINKAIPIVELPTNLKGVEDQLLSTVTLSKGWTWADGDIMLSVQNGGYKARLIVDDTNYDYTGVEGYNKENHYVERTLNVFVASKEAGSIQKEVKKGNNAPDIKIPMTESQLANIVLTDEEKKAVEKGSDIKIVLTVDDASGQIGIKDKAVVESVLGEMKIGQYLNVSLLKIIDHEESRISQTRGTIKITIEIPESLRKANREFVMIRVHDGVATILKDLDTDANTITIETDRFSTYAIAYQDKQSDIAETEDRTVIGGYIILAGLAGMLLFINRKQKRI